MSSDIFLLESPSGAQQQMAEKKARLQFCQCQRRGEFPTMVKKLSNARTFVICQRRVRLTKIVR